MRQCLLALLHEVSQRVCKVSSHAFVVLDKIHVDSVPVKLPLLFRLEVPRHLLLVFGVVLDLLLWLVGRRRIGVAIKSVVVVNCFKLAFKGIALEQFLKVLAGFLLLHAFSEFFLRFVLSLQFVVPMFLERCVEVESFREVRELFLDFLVGC